MSLTTKQMYDLNNMNVAAQNISLGTMLNSLSASSVSADSFETSASAAIVVNQGNIAQNASDIEDLQDGTIDTVLGAYAYTELPTPSLGMIVYCTDGNSGSPCLALASGSTTWLTVIIGSELSGSAA